MSDSRDDDGGKIRTGLLHLRVHSAYSLLEGALPVKALAKLAAKDAQPALAITDGSKSGSQNDV